MIRFLVPPIEGGVIDFARRLQEELGPSQAQLHVITRESAAESMAGDVLILQMSGYGFQRWGAPFWLLHELSRHRERFGILGIYFHELYASGPPWSRVFWISPFQRYVARRLARLADFWMTNVEFSANWLSRHAGHKPHALLPVFCNVGESIVPAANRAAKAVVFGGASLRQQTYQMAGPALFEWLQRGSLVLHDVGPRIEDPGIAAMLDAGGVVQHGWLDRERAGLLLQEASYGLVSYPTNCVAKSGVFAAYCANGLCPVVLSKTAVEADGLVAGRHYISGIPNRAEDPARARAIAQAALEWYRPHCLKAHAETLKALVREAGGSIG